MIPKQIHYCWFGKNKKTKLVKRCIKSWKNHCKGYKVTEWNEEKFDIRVAPIYVQQAYKAKQWAFVSDYVRLWALERFGGIYLDTDVVLLKSFDEFLKSHLVFGFENEQFVMTAVMMAEKNNGIIKEMLEEYERIHFIKEDGTFDTTPNPVRITDCLKKHGLIGDNNVQYNPFFDVYPTDYFSPKNNITGLVNKTENTVAIHLFDGAWLDEEHKAVRRQRWRLSRRQYIFQSIRGIMSRYYHKLF